MTVISLPVAAPLVFTADERRRELADLHGYWDDIPEAARSVLLATWAPGLDPARREYLWASYRQERQTEADLRAEWVGWDQVEPGLTGPDRQDRAAEKALDRANGYLHELSTGENGR